jgi:4-amino-4-deoxy-L-arabinose transferase-like glycosyltransferase
VLVALALAVRAAVVLADAGYAPAHDAFDYDRHGRSIAAGEGYPESGYVPDGGPSALRPPGYPYLLGAVYALSGDRIAVGRLVNVALGALAVLLLYLIADSIWGRRVGLTAAGLAVVFPPLVLLSRDLLSEPLFLVLELGAVLCVLGFRRSGALRWAAAAGALCGLAALTRNPGLALVLPMALGVWTLRPVLRTRALAAPALLVLCAALAIAPWTLRNAIEFGRLIPVTSSIGFALAGTYNQVSLADDEHPGAFRSPVIVPEYEVLFDTPGVDEGTLDATLRREALGFLWDHPSYVAEVTGNNLLRLFELRGGSVVGARNVEGRLVAAPDEVVEERGIGSDTPPAERAGLGIAAAFAFLGALAIARSRSPRGPWFLWLVPIVMILAAAPVNGLPRYRVPADPFLLILAAIGVVWAWDRFAAWKKRAGALKAAAATLGAVAAIGFGGCGTDDGDADGGGGATETASTSAAAPTASQVEEEKQRYIARADQICRASFRRARAIGERFTIASPGTPLSKFTEQLVAPGIPLLEDFSRRLQQLEPRPDDPDLEQYLGFFDPGLELLYQRLRAGRQEDFDEARRLELLLVELGDEQREAGRRFGLRVCDRDFLNVLLSGI